MTSRSLRNLRTTLSNTLRATDTTRLRGRLARCGATAMLLLASSNPSLLADDESGRAGFDEGAVLPPVEFRSGPVTASPRSGRAEIADDVELFQAPDARPSSAVPDVPAGRPRVVEQAHRLVPEAPPVRTASQSALAGSESQTGRTTSMTTATEPLASVDDAYADRMDQIVSGEGCAPAEQSLGDWWFWRTQQMVHRGWRLGEMKLEFVEVDPVQATRRFIADHTLPEDVEFTQDVYDVNPITRESAVIHQTAGQAVVSDEPANADTGTGTSDESKVRLKTDIRSIRPTLSYAMKNINKETLPEGFDKKLDNGEYTARASSPTVLQWAPTNFYHYPLYFEDPALERYGHTYNPIVQPFASTGRFATQLVGLPYQMALHPVHSHQYSLGYYRPGDWAPKKHYQIPFNEEATLVEAAVIAGLIIALP